MFVDYLCEAQVSVLITGSDPWRWVAYCFVDTYFDQEDGESADAYHEDRDVDEDTGIVVQPDPLTASEKDANLPISSPREYFLAVLRARIRLVKHEWHRLVRRLTELIGTYVRYFITLSNTS